MSLTMTVVPDRTWLWSGQKCSLTISLTSSGAAVLSGITVTEPANGPGWVVGHVSPEGAVALPAATAVVFTAQVCTFSAPMYAGPATETDQFILTVVAYDTSGNQATATCILTVAPYSEFWPGWTDPTGATSGSGAVSPGIPLAGSMRFDSNLQSQLTAVICGPH